MKTLRSYSHLRATRVRGVTLIELMVALVLGLIVSGAALTLFVTNKQTYTASESLGRIQEGERTAFELMSRDVREGAGNACEKGLPVANTVNGATGNWYTDFAGGIKGFGGTDAAFPFGTGTASRVSGTDAIELKSAVSGGVSIISHNPSSAEFKTSTVDNGLNDGDIAMACDFDHAAIFQVTNAQTGINNTVVHNTGTGTPGNCTKELGFPTPGCGGGPGSYAYGPNSMLAKLRATRWYVGYNGRTNLNGQPGKSLYQSTVQNTGGTLSVVNNEITEGVRDMQLGYLVDGGGTYVDASTPGIDWAKVVAVNIDITLEGQDRVGTNSAAPVLERHLQHIVAIRNRAQ